MSTESDRKHTPGFEDEPFAEFDRAKDAAKKKVLHARPVQGEVDFDELIREHLARFPKIRARLAE